ncbi:MAG TPA: hypothetical protein PK218_08775 [Flavobacterium sp.]|nr:hypothetical protein [Flavobacterium sp.]
MKKAFFFIAFSAMILLLQSCKKHSEPSTETNSVYTNNINKGLEKHNLQQLDSAFYYYNQASQTAYDGDSKAYALFQIATIQQQVGDFTEAKKPLLTHSNKQNQTFMHPIYTIF